MNEQPKKKKRPPPPLDRPPFTGTHLIWLFVITMVAGLLRLYKLGEWSLWIDEAHTFRDVAVSWDQFTESNVRNYPLSYLLLRFLYWIGMPTNEGWLRLPFTFFGIASVPALALFGRRLVGPRQALVAALILAVSPWHIYWSQNARSYAMVLFFGLLAAGTFFRGMQRRSPITLLVSLLLVLVAGLCHPSAYILLGGLLAYVLLVLRRSVTPVTTVQKWLPALILLLLVVLTFALLPLIEHVRRVKAEFSLFHLAQTLVFFVRTPLIVAAIGGVLLLFDRGERSGPFLLCWALLPLLALAFLATGLAKVTAQYAFYTLPAFCLLAAAVVTELADRVQASKFRGFLLRIVPLGILLFDMGGQTYLYFEKYQGERPMWRDAKEFLESQDGDRKRILTTNGPSMTYYLAQKKFAGLPNDGPIEVKAIAAHMLKEMGSVSFLSSHVRDARAQGIDLYVVLTEPEFEEMDPGGLMDIYLRDNFLQVRRYPNWTGPKDMTVLVYRLLDKEEPR